MYKQDIIDYTVPLLTVCLDWTMSLSVSFWACNLYGLHRSHRLQAQSLEKTFQDFKLKKPINHFFEQSTGDCFLMVPSHDLCISMYVAPSAGGSLCTAESCSRALPVNTFTCSEVRFGSGILMSKNYNFICCLQKYFTIWVLFFSKK